MTNCAKCPYTDKYCRFQNGKAPGDCPTKLRNPGISNAMPKYKDDKYQKFAMAAAAQEGAGYQQNCDGPATPVKTRLQETVEFCKRMGYKKIGLAFCLGLQHEAAIVSDVMTKNGFQVVSVVCKVGGICKEDFGIPKADKINPEDYEVMCNPIAQAEICNSENTEFNVLMGLCVGHDSMFLKNSDALCTVFAVKDRVLAHNPLGAVYTINSFYKKLK